MSGYLFYRGSQSHRSDEIIEYLKGVEHWKNHWKNDFQNLDVSAVPRNCLNQFSKIKATKQCEQNMVKLNKYEFNNYSQREVRLSLGLAYRNKKGHIIEKPNSNIKLSSH